MYEYCSFIDSIIVYMAGKYFEDPWKDQPHKPTAEEEILSATCASCEDWDKIRNGLCTTKCEIYKALSKKRDN